jgi:hypothetical protein
MNFLNKTAFNDVFGKYIPSFEYIVINLNDISEEDLYRFGDTLSFVLLIDKIKGPKDMRLLKNIPQDNIKRFSQNYPDDLKQLLSDVIGTLMRRVNVPADAIADITNKIQKRRVSEMFDLIEEWDVQEIKRQAQKDAKEAAMIEAREMAREMAQEIAMKAVKEAREEAMKEARKVAMEAINEALEVAMEARKLDQEVEREKTARIVEQSLLKLGANQDMLDQVMQSLRTQLHEA